MSVSEKLQGKDGEKNRLEGLGRKFVSVPVLCRTNSGGGLSAGFSLDPTGFRGSDGIGRNQRRPTLELFSGGKKIVSF